MINIYSYQLPTSNISTTSNTLQIILGIVATLISIAAFAVSIYNAQTSKKRMITQIISKNRVLWIEALKKDLSNFIQEYTSEKPNQTKLKQLKANIELHLRQDVKIYQGLIDRLSQCVADENFSNGNCKNLIIESQKSIDDVWQRIKRESGISYKSELKLKRKLKEEKEEKRKRKIRLS